jgi:hypothetical protein
LKLKFPFRGSSLSEIHKQNKGTVKSNKTFLWFNRPGNFSTLTATRKYTGVFGYLFLVFDCSFTSFLSILFLTRTSCFLAMNFLQFPKVNTRSIESIPTGRCNQHNLLTSWRKVENSRISHTTILNDGIAVLLKLTAIQLFLAFDQQFGSKKKKKKKK